MSGASPDDNQRAAIVTGASSGIGLAIARLLGEEGYGLTIASRRPEKLEAAASELAGAGYEVQHVAGNMGSEDVVREVVAAHRDRFGRLDVLVNNAGFLDAGWQPITADSAPASDWKKVFDVNIYGVYLVTRHLLPFLLGTPKGLKTVLGITSMSSHFASPSIAMGMSNLTLNRFMEFLAASYEAEGLMSYALHPGGR